MTLKCTVEYCYDVDIVCFAIVLGICAAVIVLWVFWLIQKSRFFRRIGYESPTVPSPAESEDESNKEEHDQHRHQQPIEEGE
mmetsp:Transcript_5187/g.8727  ORF Transcript_5187/g.8727 Transcript_5187/m.8727 type:complete len:82 (-) Transcript_5187:188-433(-)